MRCDKVNHRHDDGKVVVHLVEDPKKIIFGQILHVWLSEFYQTNQRSQDLVLENAEDEGLPAGSSKPTQSRSTQDWNVTSRMKKK